MALPGLSFLPVHAHRCVEKPQSILVNFGKTSHGCTVWSAWQACSQLPTRRKRMRGCRLQSRWTVPEVGVYISQLSFTGPQFQYPAPHRMQVHEPKLNRGHDHSFHHTKHLRRPQSMLYMLLHCYLKKRTVLQTVFILWVSNTQPVDHKLNTLVVNNLSRYLSVLFCYYKSVRSSTVPHSCHS